MDLLAAASVEAGSGKLRRPAVSAAAGVLAGGLVLAFLALAPLPGRQAKDWVHLWIAGRMVCDGHYPDLYNPQLHYDILQQAFPQGLPPGIWPARNVRLGAFFYPPVTALYYAAFAWMGLAPAATVHCVVAVALAVLVAWLLRGLAGGGVTLSAALCAVLAYPPFFYNYVLGQNAMAAAVVVLAFWWLATRHRDLAAGLCLGVLACKPNWLVAVGWIPLLFWRRRMLAGAVLSAVLVTALGVALGGWRVFEDYLRVFPQVVDLPQQEGYELRLQCSALGLSRKWFGTAGTLAGWGLAAAVVVIVRWRWRGAWSLPAAEFRRFMALCVLTALVINPHLNNYDLVLLAAATVLLRAAPCPSPWQRRLELAVIAANYLACPIDNGWSYWQVAPLPALALLALWGVAVFRPRGDGVHVARDVSKWCAAVGPQMRHSLR